MAWAGAAAATDQLRSGCEPFFCEGSKAGGIAFAGPAAGLGVPAFAGVGIDDDGLGRGLAKFGNEGGDSAWRGAVHTDGDGLREGGGERGARSQRLVVGHLKPRG